jgi:hypothetical protein
MAAEAAARFLAEMGDDDDDAIYGKGGPAEGSGNTPVSAQNSMVLQEDDSDEVSGTPSGQKDALF